jgi:hypothetical protein
MLREAGAQRRVPACEGGKRPGERRGVQPAAQRHDAGHVEDRPIAGQAVDEPEPQLAGRERVTVQPWTSGRRRRRALHGQRGAPQRRLDRRGEGGHGGRREQLGRPQLDAQALPEARQQPHRHQRMAPKGEEVVVDADPRDAQQLGPEAGEPALERRPRGGEHLGQVAAGGARLGQRSPIDLAVRGARQRLEADEKGRDQVGRQPAQQEVAQLPAGGRGAFGHHVGRQHLAAGAVVAGRRGDLAHRRVARQGGLDLAQLDAEAAYLDLAVEPAEEMEVAAGKQAGQVTGAIDAGTRCGRAGIGQETLGGDFRAPQVASRQPLAAEVDLASLAGGNLPPLSVQEIAPAAVDGPADGWLLRRLVSADERVGRVGGVLGRAVEIEDPIDRGGAVRGFDQRSGQRLAGKVDDPHRRRHAPLAQQLPECGRHGVDQGDRQPRRQGRQRRQVGRAGREDDRASRGKRHEDLEDRQVEAHRGRRQDARQLGRREDPEGPADEGRGAAMRDGDGLGPSGGARGVDEVGEILRRHGARRVSAARRRIARRVRRVRRGSAGFQVVHQQEPGQLAGQRRQQAALADEDRRGAVFQQQGQPLGRIGRIERHIGAPRLEHGQHADHQVRAALEPEADAHLRPDTQMLQAAAQRIGSILELGVAEAASAVDESEGPGRALCLRLESLVQQRRRPAPAGWRERRRRWIWNRIVHRPHPSSNVRRGTGAPSRASMALAAITPGPSRTLRVGRRLLTSSHDSSRWWGSALLLLRGRPSGSCRSPWCGKRRGAAGPASPGQVGGPIRHGAHLRHLFSVRAEIKSETARVSRRGPRPWLGACRQDVPLVLVAIACGDPVPWPRPSIGSPPHPLPTLRGEGDAPSLSSVSS